VIANVPVRSLNGPAMAAWKERAACLCLRALPLYHIFAFTVNMMLRRGTGGKNT
jgi:hypothetical protein